MCSFDRDTALKRNIPGGRLATRDASASVLKREGYQPSDMVSGGFTSGGSGEV